MATHQTEVTLMVNRAVGSYSSDRLSTVLWYTTTWLVLQATSVNWLCRTLL